MTSLINLPVAPSASTGEDSEPISLDVRKIEDALIALLRQTFAEEIVDIAFEQPSRTWAERITKPTLNLYLHDMRENAKLRKMSPPWEISTTQTGKMLEQRAPVRVDLHYMVTAWASDPRDEHALLWDAMQVLFRYLCLDAFITPELKVDRMPVALQVGQEDSLGRPAEIWSALNNEMHPAFACTLTVPMFPHKPIGVRWTVGTIEVLMRQRRFDEQGKEIQPAPPPKTLEDRERGSLEYEVDKEGKLKLGKNGRPIPRRKDYETTLAITVELVSRRIEELRQERKRQLLEGLKDNEEAITEAMLLLRNAEVCLLATMRKVKVNPDGLVAIHGLKSGVYELEIAQEVSNGDGTYKTVVNTASLQVPLKTDPPSGSADQTNPDEVAKEKEDEVLRYVIEID